MQRIVIATVAAWAGIAAFAAAGDGGSAHAPSLVAAWRSANELCRGLPGDDPRSESACADRERLGASLDRLNWCYGKKSEAGFQKSWHRCGPTSSRPGRG